MILSDTYECPHCGHVFDARKSRQSTSGAPANRSDLKSANLHEECRTCGVMVRVGLVRCWNCNTFMRDDIARRYEMMTTTPQKIIYSDIPEEHRTDYLPARAAVPGSSMMDDQATDSEDGFTLGSDVTSSAAEESEFELDNSVSGNSRAVSEQRAVPEQRVAAPVEGPDKPQSTTPGGKPKSEGTAETDGDTEGTNKLNDDALAGAAGKFAAAAARGPGKSVADVDSDDLHSIAMQEQKEFRRRRVEKLAEARRKRIMIPCPSCGSWIRVQEEQAGRVVRCPQCKGAVAIPEIRKKAEKKSEKATSDAPVADLPWIDDARLHLLNPTALILKPGSLADQHMLVDIAITPSGLAVVNLNKDGVKKKSFLGKSSGPTPAELQERRKQVKNLIAKSADTSVVPQVEVRPITTDLISQLRIVQPVAKVHESMFAGVPVFGDGRIAIYLPIDGGNGQQVFCSLTLSQIRTLAEKLKSQFQLSLPLEENGIPETEKSDTLLCFYTQSKIDSIRNLSYYQQDPAFTLELSGHRCAACGITVSEEGRLKNKLGGANGKGIAKAKCPKCAGKFGSLPLYRIAKSAAAAEADPAVQS
ncbi:MAG: hypothetical protein JNL58_17040 [Planctomyces sp.]|nr:hypothetical protein [Planctomyces sp.]